MCIQLPGSRRHSSRTAEHAASFGSALGLTPQIAARRSDQAPMERRSRIHLVRDLTIIRRTALWIRVAARCFSMTQSTSQGTTLLRRRTELDRTLPVLHIGSTAFDRTRV